MMKTQSDTTVPDAEALRQEVADLLRGLTVRQLLFLRTVIYSFPK